MKSRVGVQEGLSKYRITPPYLETTTSKQVENTKAFELTIIKELGKLTP